MSLSAETLVLPGIEDHRIAAAAASTSTRELSAMPREFLSFRLGREEYGIDILRVQEIRSYETPTRIANAPALVKGVLDLRGTIVPIVDLRLAMGCDSASITSATVVIVLNLKGRVVGAVVDSVSDVLALERDSIRPPPDLGASACMDHLLGVGCTRSGDAERMLILVDIEALMGSAEIGLLDPVA